MENETQVETEATEQAVIRPCCRSQVGLGDAVPADLKAKMGRMPVGRHCDVCMLLDGDTTPKEVMYCKFCDAFMCEACRRNNWRRTGATIARHTRKLISWLQGALTPIKTK
jgi:hypothetical protein